MCASICVMFWFAVCVRVCVLVLFGDGVLASCCLMSYMMKLMKHLQHKESYDVVICFKSNIEVILVLRCYKDITKRVTAF